MSLFTNRLSIRVSLVKKSGERFDRLKAEVAEPIIIIGNFWQRAGNADAYILVQSDATHY